MKMSLTPLLYGDPVTVSHPTFVSLPAEAKPDSHGKYRKIPNASNRGSEKTHFKIREQSVFNKVCPQEK